MALNWHFHKKKYC